MADALQQVDQSKVSSGSAAIIIQIVGMFGASILRDLKVLTFPDDYMVAYAVAFLIGYWLPPKPPHQFSHYAVRVLTIVSCLHAGLWAIPKMLDRVLWTPAAYGLPAFALFIAAYWMKPLLPTNAKQDKFWIHLMIAAAGAIGYAWMVVKSLEVNH